MGFLKINFVNNYLKTIFKRLYFKNLYFIKTMLNECFIWLNTFLNSKFIYKRSNSSWFNIIENLLENIFSGMFCIIVLQIFIFMSAYEFHLRKWFILFSKQFLNEYFICWLYNELEITFVIWVSLWIFRVVCVVVGMFLYYDLDLVFSSVRTYFL